jgi:hypothetical protein
MQPNNVPQDTSSCALNNFQRTREVFAIQFDRSPGSRISELEGMYEGIRRIRAIDQLLMGEIARVIKSR